MIDATHFRSICIGHSRESRNWACILNILREGIDYKSSTLGPHCEFCNCLFNLLELLVAKCGTSSDTNKGRRNLTHSVVPCNSQFKISSRFVGSET